MNKITSSLKEKSILVDHDAGFYNPVRRDKRIESEVSSIHNVSSAAGEYHKKLFMGCAKPFGALRKITQDAREDSILMTLPWEPNRRLLLNKNVLSYKQLQAKHQFTLDEAKTKLADAYDALLYTAEKNLGTMFRREDYPSIQQILSECYIRHTFYALSDASDVRLDCDADMVREIQQEVRANQALTYNNAVLSSWERLIDIVKNATSNLSKLDASSGARFRTEWYDKLSELLPILSGLNLDDDPRLDAMSKRCFALLSLPADEYAVNLTARAQAYTKAQSIYDDLSSIYGSLSGGTK